ncbi:MAG: DUF5610 domain-containing protein [Thermodesulfobacteriota bacterium]
MDIPAIPSKNALIIQETQDKNKTEKNNETGPLNVDANINSQIVASYEKLSFSIKDNELELIYKNATISLNEILAPILGEEGLEAVEPDDYTPEAVANRIVQFSTAFFESYKRQNPSMSEEDALNNFMGIIEGAIETGINEAKDILEGLKVLEGNVDTNIEKTYQLIREGLDRFRDSFDATEEDS